MHIFTIILSILAALISWYPFWSILITLPALIIATIMFYKYFIGTKKETYTKGRPVVFASFVIAIIAMISSLVMAGTTLGIYLLLAKGV